MTSLRSDRRVLGNVVRLSAAQALSGANASVIYATGAIVGAKLAPDPGLATLPISVFVVGMALGTLPIGWLARTYGRRIAFLAGAGMGTVAGLLAALAVHISSFPLFCLATLFAGFYGAVVQSFRFAAADGVSPVLQPKALAWVMAGGIFSGVLGPQLVTWTMNLSPDLFMASYLAQAVVAVVAGLVLSGVDLPRPRVHGSAGRPLREIIGCKGFVIAALCGVVTYALMNLMMTSAPLAMQICGLPIAASNMAIEWHIVAMYAPSFITGMLIARFGAPRVVATGLVLILCAAGIGLSGQGTWQFVSSLVLLGLGWNFGFVGASSMVLRTHRPEERTRVQSFNDFLVFGTMAVGSFSSGQVLSHYGWQAVCYVILIPAAATLAVILLPRQPAKVAVA